MKLRVGFVSNSSSSSYIVLLPSDFNISDDKIRSHEYFGSYMCDNDIEDEDEAVIKIKNDLHSLVYSGSIYEEECYETFNFIHSLVSNYVVTSLDTDSDRGCIKNITNRDAINTIKKLVRENRI